MDLRCAFSFHLCGLQADEVPSAWMMAAHAQVATFATIDPTTVCRSSCGFLRLVYYTCYDMSMVLISQTILMVFGLPGRILAQARGSRHVCGRDLETDKGSWYSCMLWLDVFRGLPPRLSPGGSSHVSYVIMSHISMNERPPSMSVVCWT